MTASPPPPASPPPLTLAAKYKGVYPAVAARSEWDAFYDAHERAAFGVAYRLTGNVEDAKDFTQEAFYKAYCNWDRTREPSRSWLLTILYHLVVDRQRQRRVAKFLSLDWWRTWRGPVESADDERQPDESWEWAPDDVEADYIDRETEREIREVLSRLRLKDRMLLALREERVSYDDSAAVLKTTRKAVKAGLWRARNRVVEQAKRLGYWDSWTAKERPAVEVVA